jgi:hypothetical protein
MEILATAKQCDEVRLLREWSYAAKRLSVGPAFLCGDAACFIDPLFSQGVHLATYSGMLAAAAIDYLSETPQDAAEVHAWYDSSYREAYNRYHKFVAGFYACNEEPDSRFWSSRKISGAKDQRFDDKDWFTSMTGQQIDAGAEGVEELEQGAATLAYLWQHGTSKIDDGYDQTELSTRRIAWANDLLKQFQSMAAIRWVGDEARLVSSFKVHPTTFKLERQYFLGNEHGRTMRAYAVTPEHRRLFDGLRGAPLSFQQLSSELKRLGGHGTPVQVLGRLFEERLLSASDRAGKPVRLRSALRFGGVGAEDDLS